MGAYSRTEKSVNGGYPVYTKKGKVFVDGQWRDGTHYLYRAGAGEDTGRWMVAWREENITNLGGDGRVLIGPSEGGGWPSRPPSKSQPRCH